VSHCLVIGGCGFIGRSLTRMLHESGREVVVLGRRADADRSLPGGCRYVSGDYADRATLRALLRPGCEVIDLAYATVPKTSFENPVFDVVSNLPASVGLLQECAASGVRRVLMVSSGGTVYGTARALPVDEEHPTVPLSPYGITKLTTERYAGLFHSLSALPVVVVRPSNAYGEGQRAGTGQGFIATAVDAIIRGREITLFGPEGTVRDYIHVDDLAAGIAAALEKGGDGQVYNIGTGVGTSNAGILDVLRPLAEAAGFAVRVRVEARRGFDVAANVLDCSRLAGCSGWSPQVSLGDGLRMVWESRLRSV
jgi:UDP-glucose 4-epimerase